MEDKTVKRPIEPADLFRLEFITDARLSPDGKHVVYTISHVDAEEEKEFCALWLLSLQDGSGHQLTAGTAMDSSPAWSPDGKTIAFLSTRTGDPQIYLIPVDGGEARQLTFMEQKIGEGPAWSPDGSTLAFTATNVAEKRHPNQPYRVTRAIYRFNNVGYLDNTVQDIYVMPAIGGEPRNLTKDAWMNSDLRWSPDGQEILYQANLGPHSFDVSSELRSVDLKGNIHSIVTRVWGEVGTADWSPDGKRIVFTGKQKEHPMGYKQDLWVINRRGGTPRCRSLDFQGHVGGGLQDDIPVRLPAKICITADGQRALAQVQLGGGIYAYEFTLQDEQEYKPLLEGVRSALLLDADQQHILFAGSSWHEPINLYLADRDGGNEKKLTHLNENIIDRWLLPEVENLHFKGADDDEVEGWIMKPTTGEPPYPTVLYIHGGPSGAFGNAFHFDFSMLSGAGYAVLFTNPHGSTGYGSAFGTDLNLRWGEIDYKDQMAGIDHVIEKGLADPERLGVCGLSYGGYMTCWMITQTDRFKGAVSENPVSDLVSDYGVGDASVWMDLEAIGGHPHEVPENYRKASPITFAHKCTTPTLMLQGEADYRCPVPQTEQFYTSLKVNGCIVEMVRFPDSAHADSINGAPVIRKAQNEELLGWMNRYVKTSEEEKQ
jgi:dipeptidyl aminopeptidase/acylaminoacyl peptidase